MMSGNVALHKCHIYHNNAVLGGGVAVLDGHALFNSTKLYSNNASSGGGAAHIANGLVVFHWARVFDNVAECDDDDDSTPRDENYDAIKPPSAFSMAVRAAKRRQEAERAAAAVPLISRDASRSSDLSFEDANRHHYDAWARQRTPRPMLGQSKRRLLDGSGRSLVGSDGSLGSSRSGSDSGRRRVDLITAKLAVG